MDLQIQSDAHEHGRSRELFLLYLAVNRIFWGMAATFAYVYLRFLIELAPVPLMRYVFIVPASVILVSAAMIPSGIFACPRWNRLVAVIRGSAAAAFLLSPFWTWWNSAPDSAYCTANMILLCGASLLFMNLLNSCVIFLSGELGFGWTMALAKCARFALIYLSLPCLVAFAMLVAAGRYPGSVIVQMVAMMEPWKIIICLLPAFMALAALYSFKWNLRKAAWRM